MTQESRKPRKNILVVLVAIASIVGLLVATLQLWQRLAEANAQREKQSTLIAVSEHQLAAQQTLIALQQASGSAQEIVNMQATIVALENERLFAQATLTPGLVVQTKNPDSMFAVISRTETPAPAPASTASLALLFEDNFDDGNADGWIPSVDSWGVVEGSYVCIARDQAETTYGAGIWTDYSVNADVKPFSGTVDVGIIGRWQDEQNFYMAQLVGGKAYLTRREGGGWNSLASAPYASQNGTSYNIMLEFRGTKINMYVDKTLIVSVEDGVFLQGKAGLRCASNSQASFDNVRIMSTSDQ
jgi:hypothetical protein